LGYRPNSIAQSLASNRSNSVGILVPELHGPFFGTMLSCIEEELRTAGKHVIITAGHSDKDKEKESLEFLVSRQCDALIVHVFAVSNDYLLELAAGPVPIVLIGRDLPQIADRCFSIDNEQGGYLATRSLLEQGHRELAYLAGPLWKSDGRGRFAGHLRALAEYGVEFNEDLLAEGNYQEASGRRGMQELLERGGHFSALVCGNDEMAAGAIAFAWEQGLTIPDDLSVIGFDNVFFTRYMHPQLSTINYPIDAMGHMAARCILKNVYGMHDIEIRNRFEAELVQRDSTTALLQ